MMKLQALREDIITKHNALFTFHSINSYRRKVPQILYTNITSVSRANYEVFTLLLEQVCPPCANPKVRGGPSEAGRRGPVGGGAETLTTSCNTGVTQGF